MKKIKFLVVVTTFLMVFTTCSENDPGVVPPEDEKPIPTPVGIPNGTPTSKTIGAGGGTIVSLDGMMGLEIPEGALSVDTEITIQPITNFVPNGNGNAYQLGPEGTKFNKPIKITFKHGQEISATMPPLTGIAFQGTDGIWYSSGKFTWDETNKTVSTETTHFSGWGTFDDLRIVPKDYHVAKFGKDGRPFYQLKANERAEFQLIVLSNMDPKQGEELSPLVPVEYSENTGLIIKSWSVNGEVNGKKTGKYGTITVNGDDSVCTYTAPPNVPAVSKNPVQLSVDLRNLKYKFKNPNGQVQVFNDLMVTTQIEIIGEFNFNLELKYKNSDISGGLGDFIMTDLINLKIHVRDGKVTVSDISNGTGNITPASFEKGGCTHKWVSRDSLGFTVANAEGFIISGGPVNSSKDYINVTLNGPSKYAAWESKCDGEVVTSIEEESSKGYIVNASFILKDSVQTEDVGYYFTTLTPE